MHIPVVGFSNAFNALVSLPTIALYVSYFVPIALIHVRKLCGSDMDSGPWRLDCWGVPVNIFSLCYIIVVWTPFPQFLPITASTFNYLGPILLAVIAFALLDWVTTGKKLKPNWMHFGPNLIISRGVVPMGFTPEIRMVYYSVLDFFGFLSASSSKCTWRASRNSTLAVHK